MRLVVRGGRVFTLDAASRVLDAADVYIDGDRIVGVGPLELPFSIENADQVVEADGCYVLPGLVNAHGHLALGLFRGLGEFAPGQDWPAHFERQSALAAGLKDEHYFLGAQLLIAEMLRAGITSFADIHFEPPGAPPVTEWIAQAAEAAGIRAAVCLEMNGYVNTGGMTLRHVPEEAERTAQQSLAFAQKWHGRGQGRITAMLGLANPPVPVPADLERVTRNARESGLPIQMHLAEIAHEMAEWREVYGRRPTQALQTAGMLEHHVLGGNVVFLEAEDAALLRDHDFHASTCPQNCAKLALGMLDLPLMLAKGVNVCLGTNEVANNNNLDMLEEMRFAALYHKLHSHDPRTLAGDEPLRLITERGGRALGTGAGVLAPGRPADLVVLHPAGPHMHPEHDPLANIVYSAASADVRDVIIAGQLVMEGRRVLTLDVDAVIKQLEAGLEPLRAGLPPLRPGLAEGPFELRWKAER